MKKIVLLVLFLCFHLAIAQTRFNHILITNDDGIEDIKRLLALANSVSNVADRVSIIVSDSDKSGTSNYSVIGKDKSGVEVICKNYDEEKNIAVYNTSANPADCVILGLGGFFNNNRPDLVICGINGGANIGPAWFGSGTIGAVRTAAYLGVNSIAFSGFDDENELSLSIIPTWIKQFISSGFLDELLGKSYLTVAFPPTSFDEIKGVKLAERRLQFDFPKENKFKNTAGVDPNVVENKTTWELDITGNRTDLNIKYDDFYLQKGFVIITPMTFDENNDVLLKSLSEKTDLIPDIPN
ncbi:MAG: 5'/3'-nucleotidase SurE [Ignavibacteria bacterium]|nr:5'/3'-nucleotidase SurE [Ignavibacteria bacterium]